MARERTILAADRTLMAWIRTTLSMISFGFTIYKFLQAMFESGKSLIARPQGAAKLRAGADLLGLWALAIACLQYWREAKRLQSGSDALLAACRSPVSSHCSASSR